MKENQPLDKGNSSSHLILEHRSPVVKRRGDVRVITSLNAFAGVDNFFQDRGSSFKEASADIHVGNRCTRRYGECMVRSKHVLSDE